MRLITHNLLKCHKKGVVSGYPLGIVDAKVEYETQEYSEPLMTNLLSKLDFPVFVEALKQLKIEETPEKDDLKQMHKFLMELQVIEGTLVCPESGRQFPIKNGIPNMLLNEDEV